MLAQQVDMHIIAHIHSGFSQKFGIPRQSGLSDALKATIVFEDEEFPLHQGDAVRILPSRKHKLRNDMPQKVKVLFIKSKVNY